MREEAVELVIEDGYEIEHLDNEFKEDETILYYAVRFGGYDLNEWEEKEVRNKLRKTLKAYDEAIARLKEESKTAVLEWDERLKKDRLFAIEAVRVDGLLIKEFDDSVRNDKEVAREAMLNNVLALFNLKDELKNDKDFVLSAVEEAMPLESIKSKELREELKEAMDKVRSIT